MRHLLCILCMVFASGASAWPAPAPQDDKDPKNVHISILSPAGGAVLQNAVVDVVVSFASGKDGGTAPARRVSSIDLRANGTVVATVDVAKKPTSALHTFPTVDLSGAAASGNPVSLVARAFLGGKETKFVDSAVVLVTVNQPGGAPPAPSITSPVSGARLNTVSPLVSGTSSSSGLTITLLVDAVANGTTTSVAGGAWSLTSSTPLAQGTRSLTATASNGSGTSVPSAAVSVVIDTVAPAVSGPQPASGESTSNTTPLIGASWSDPAPGSGVNTASAVIQVDNVAVLASVNPGGFSYTPPPLGAGTHTVSARVSDFAGNPSAVLTWSFTVTAAPVDTTPPVVSNLVPATGSFIGSARPAMSALLTDAGGSGLKISSAALVLNGVAVPALVTPQNANSATISFTPPADLAQGPHAFTVTVSDNASNATSAVSSFTVDVTAPVVTISGPTPGQIFSDPAVPITASATDALTGVPLALVSIALNGVNRTNELTRTEGVPNGFGFPSSVSISGILTSAVGQNILSVTAVDPAGNATTVNRTYEVSAPPPPPPTDQIVLTKISGDGQTITAGEATDSLVVRATFLSSGAPVPNLTLIFTSGAVGDRFSSINAIGPITNSGGDAGVRFVPGQAGAASVTVGVLEDDSVAPVTFTVNAQAVSLGNVTSIGPCNLLPGTSEYPGSALPMLMKWKATRPNGSLLVGARVVARVLAFNGASPPPFKVGDFLPSSAVTDANGEATFAFVISPTATAGGFTMEFSLPDYPNANGAPVFQTLGGTVREDSLKPRNFGDTEIVWDDPDQSGQGQIGIPGKNVYVPLRARFFGASSGGGITFRIIEGDGTFEAGTEGDFVGSRADDNCAKITGNIRATVSEGSTKCRGNIRFKLAAGFTHALIAMDSFTDIFAVGPPEVHVQGSANGGVIHDAILPADFRNLSGAPQFKIQMYAPRDLDSAPTFNVTSQTTSMEPLPAFPNDVAPVTVNNLTTNLASTNARYGVWESTQPILFLPDRALLGDLVPTLGGVALVQGSDFGGLKLLALGPAKGETRVAVARLGATPGNPGQSDLFYDPNTTDANKRDSAFLAIGVKGAPGIKQVEYKFSDGAVVTQTGAQIGDKVNHTFTLNKSPRETLTCTATILYNTGEQAALVGTMRISNKVGPLLPKGQADLDATYTWDEGETPAGDPPTAFVNLVPTPGGGIRRDPFVQTIPALVAGRMTTAGLTVPSNNVRLIYKASLPGDQKAGGSSKVFELTLFDFRNYDVFGSYVGDNAYEWTRPEQTAIINHHVKHVVDLNDARLGSPGSSGLLIKQVYEQYKINQGVQGNNATDPPTNPSWNALSNCFDPGPGGKRGPHAFLELEPMVTQALEPAVAHDLLNVTMLQLTVWFNNTTDEFRTEAGIQQAHKTFVVNQYKRLLAQYPELKHYKEFHHRVRIKPPEF